jgi:hypothetical protein
VADERGIHLVVRLDETGLAIVQAAWIGGVSREGLRAPLLTPDSAPPLPSPAAELALAVLDREGHVLDSFGWPARSIAFFDETNPADPGGLRGFPAEVDQPFLILRVPAAAAAAFLFFYASEVTAVPAIAGRGSAVAGFFQRPLGLYYLGGPEPMPPVPPLPVPGPLVSEPLAMPWMERASRSFGGPSDEEGGYVIKAETIVANGPPADRFDLVILGEGFLHTERDAFKKRAELLSESFLSMPPFDAVAGLINVHAVSVASIDSGVTSSPVIGVPKRSYFHVRGGYKYPHNPGYFGTDTPEKIWAAAELIAPICHLELLLVVVNVGIRGGSAFPKQDLAFVPLCTTMDDFINIAAHECAHAMVGLAEEYIGCEPPLPLMTYPNRATEAEVQAGRIWWKRLARRDELDPRGDFRTVHRFGDPFDPTGREPVVPRDLEGMLGVYWGCQEIDKTLPPIPGVKCDPYKDPRGRYWYRGMARCKMRKASYGFCRVCSHVLTRFIEAFAS